MRRIGITTTVPAEFVYAAGDLPVDLNNIFISDINASGFIERAEIDGLPRSTCGWIKGMYGAAKECGIDAIIAVSDGDCSHTRTLLEILHADGMPVIPFAYPYDRDASLLKKQMEKLAKFFGVSFKKAEETMRRLDVIRKKIAEIDLATWRDNVVTGFENHLLHVSGSDFDQDPDAYERKCDLFLEQITKREPMPQKIRLAFIGVPPIYSDLYQFLESIDARVVFNEVQRQFAFPFDTGDIVERYLRYTYPYDVAGRLEDIKRELERREVDGVIHYAQSFCHRQMEDIMFRKNIDLPFITIEGDAPQPLDARTKLRLESFCEMIAVKQETAK